MDPSVLPKTEFITVCLKVVPMDWSWAMWIAQKIHTIHALRGCGLDESRLLKHGCAPRSLGNGEPVVVVYVDNLGMGGIDADRVRKVFAGAKSHLTSIGFDVHEEKELVAHCDSLGYNIDGCLGLVRPQEGLGTITVINIWLSRRPVVSGRSIEKFIGRAIHMFMINRCFLAILRSLYDFVHCNYDRPVRLWRSAAREALHVARLLPFCQADIRKLWVTRVTIADASLSGYAVGESS